MIRCNSEADSIVWMKEERQQDSSICCLLAYADPGIVLFRGFLVYEKVVYGFAIDQIGYVFLCEKGSGSLCPEPFYFIGKTLLY